MLPYGKVWDVPEPRSVREVRMEDGTVISLRRHGNPTGPRLVLSHGNGLAIDLYFPFWSLLLDEFDLVVFDLRNHGWNALTATRNHNIITFTQDQGIILEAIDRHFGAKPKVGVFHSVSALATLLSTSARDGFAGLVLFDPPICSRGRSYVEFEEAAQRMAAFARRRASRFPTRRHLVELLPYSPTFQRVVPGVFDLLSVTTLREAEDGEGFELCCPPHYEAQIIEYAGNFAVLVDFEQVHCPVKVLGADPTLPYSYLPTFDLRHVVRVDYDWLPGATHFLQLEQPSECVSSMREFLESIEFLGT